MAAERLIGGDFSGGDDTPPLTRSGISARATPTGEAELRFIVVLGVSGGKSR